MKTVEQIFTEWADSKLSPRPDPGIDWHTWKPEAFEAFKAGLGIGYEDSASIAEGLVYALDNGGNQYRREASASKVAARIKEVSRQLTTPPQEPGHG